MRLKITISYDGTNFSGWQVQPNIDTVQGRIEAALAEVAKEPIRLHGSGRTDTGVHALGQVAHFDAPDHLTMNPFNWVPALNTKLPDSIRVLSCEEVPPEFHARYDAKGKTYTYHLCTLPILPPFTAGRAWHLPRLLNPETLTEALEMFMGEHDFRSFCSNRGNETEATDYHRVISEASFIHTDDGLILTFSGNGFLYKMVRFLTGAAVNASQGYLRLDDLHDLIEKPSDKKSPLCAPADGLSLLQVDY